MVDHLEYMQEFLNKIQTTRSTIVKTLFNLKSKGKTIVAYGAPAKTTTLLHYWGVGSDTIDFIVDDSSLKIGKYMPGSHIPIISPKELYKWNPDYVLITAWNFADPIIKKLRENGYKGKVIVP